jgi:hypothetical protein
MCNVFDAGKAACQEAWNLLKRVPDYKTDYKQQEDSIKSKKNIEKLQKQIQAKWGYSPLDDPSNEKPSFHFACFFEGFLGKGDLQELAVGIRSLKIYSFKKRKHINFPVNYATYGEFTFFDSDNKIGIDIDLSASDNIIFNQLREILLYIRKRHSIRKTSIAKYDPQTFVVKILRQIGYTNKKIEYFLTPKQHRKKPYDDSRRESYRKQITRRLKK